jgi:DUF438 domain-containing protein
MIGLGLTIFFGAIFLYFFGGKIIHLMVRESADCPKCKRSSSNLIDDEQLSKEFEQTTKTGNADKRYSKHNETKIKRELTFKCINNNCDSFDKEFKTIKEDSYSNTDSSDIWGTLRFFFAGDKKLQSDMQAAAEAQERLNKSIAERRKDPEFEKEYQKSLKL